MYQADFAPMQPSSNLHLLPAGTVVTTSRGLYSHVGILTEPTFGAERRVISLNPGPLGSQVLEEPLSAFARGKPVKALPSKTALQPRAILARARSGQHPTYSWVTFNCEHFVNFALGVPVRSPQIAFWGLAAMALVALNR